jgi:hypothetical protein
VDGVSVEVGYDRFMVTAKIGAENISGVERKSSWRDDKFDCREFKEGWVDLFLGPKSIGMMRNLSGLIRSLHVFSNWVFLGR